MDAAAEVDHVDDRAGDARRLDVEALDRDLLVDEVGDVININGETLQPAPHTLDSHWKSVTTGVFRLEKRLFIILHVAAVLKLS